MTKNSKVNFHKSLLHDVHTWKVCYTETQTKKRKSFTCTEKMKKAHEMNLNNNPFVMDVMMTRAGRHD